MSQVRILSPRPSRGVDTIADDASVARGRANEYEQRETKVSLRNLPSCGSLSLAGSAIDHEQRETNGFSPLPLFLRLTYVRSAALTRRVC